MLEQDHSEVKARTIVVNKAFVSMREVLATTGATLRGSVLGFIAGVLPGAGASLGAFLAYTFEKRYSDRNGTFGFGDPRGVAAPEAGNNAAAGGALVPMLSLGVPGSGTTAVLLALLISLNITPGPLLFQNEPDIVWGLIASLFFANFVLLAMNLPMVGLFTRMLAMPLWALMPFVVMISFVGIYSINHSPFDLLVMLGFGLFGYALRKLDIPLVPIVLGLLLGRAMENSFRRALSISGGDYGILLGSGISITLYLMTAALLLTALYLAVRKRRAMPEPLPTDASD